MMPHLCPRKTRLHSIAAALLAALLGTAAAQTAQHLQGNTRDRFSNAIPNVTIAVAGPSGNISTQSDSSGNFRLDYPSAGTLTISASTRTMTSDPKAVTAAAPCSTINLILYTSAVAQQITVTATRSSLDLPATANTTYTLNSTKLHAFPALALDDQLRQQAGFELYRRSSSRVQNPTSQGISLRGLGSTAASRTLVLEESIPMNDPFGGWIHWDEIPAETVEAVTLATGGGSDLYGSSALGGVIDVVPAHPSGTLFNANASAGAQDTSSVGVRGDIGAPRYRQLLAGDSFRTSGYMPTDPAAAGPIDVPANAHYQSARTETDRVFTNSGRAFVIGNLLDEARGNGTLLTTNGTRLWRYIAGDDWAAARASGRIRLFGSDEAYRQTFSSINTARTTETLTRLQHVHTQELGASTDAARAFSRIALVAGADVRDIRGTDIEASYNTSPGVDTSERQRFAGGFVEALASAQGGPFRNVTAALSMRLDSAASLDTRTITQPNPLGALTPNRSEFIASPRFGLTRSIGSLAAIHASVFRAFRTPTMNELYRTGQVGAQITRANPQLESERATGWEAGMALTTEPVTLGATYFWTEINRPVSAVLLSTNLYVRENLGQIVSQGTELHVDLYQRRAISATLGYQYAHAIVTRFSAQPTLIGNWIPEVPRQSLTAQLRATNERIGELTLAARASGRAWDDSANTSLLRAFVQLDLFARRDFGAHWSASLILDNLFNQRPDVARTPVLTLGSPLLAQGGIAFHWNGPSAH